MFETSESQPAYQITSSGLTCKASLHILRYARPSEWGRVPAVSFDVGAVGSVAGRPACLVYSSSPPLANEQTGVEGRPL